MDPNAHLSELSRTIQLAVAPVFLLTALGTILSVLSARLGRIVDRSRVLVESGDRPNRSKAVSGELASLGRRRRLVYHAITSATIAALFVCFLIAAAFLGYMLRFDFSKVMAALFVAAMGAFITTLLLFLREVLIAVATSASESDTPRDDAHG